VLGEKHKRYYISDKAEKERIRDRRKYQYLELKLAKECVNLGGRER